MDYDVIVFIGRFQPFHNGHLKVLEHALSISKRVVVLVGSSNSARTVRNPFTFEERKEMINGSVSNTLTIRPLNDYPYDDQRWIDEVQTRVRESIIDNIEGNTKGNTLHGMRDIKIGLIGHSKDDTSYYLGLFPSWERVPVPYHHNIDATEVRDHYFQWAMTDTMVPSATLEVMESFRGEPVSSTVTEFMMLSEDYWYYKNYKEEAHQYPRIEQTVDAVVLKGDYVLLIKRKNTPGRGLYALPGGFVNPTERLEDAMLRELKEETGIHIPLAGLKEAIVTSDVFDEPNRSSRGRVISQAYLVDLEAYLGLPLLTAGDDAASAGWVSTDLLGPQEMFEDHYHIIQKMRKARVNGKYNS